jgi:3-oxoacyl-[acyl-carrier protein] reductase
VRVAICGRDKGRLDDAVARLGSSAVGLTVDVSTAQGGASFVATATEALGGVDILVPNGGGPPPGTFASTDVEAYLPAVHLNLLSVVAMCKAAVPAMQEQRWGRVVAITSIAVRQPIANLILSNTARTGVTGFLKTLALEVAREGVTVNSVQPGPHATNRIMSLYGFTPEQIAAGIAEGTMGDPGDFGRVVAFLCSESARFITGVQLPVDGCSYLGLQ